MRTIEVCPGSSTRRHTLQLRPCLAAHAAVSITLKTDITGDGRLKLDVPADLPPGPVEVVVVIQPEEPRARHSLRELRGLGADIWKGVDAQQYVNRLRDEWER